MKRTITFLLLFAAATSLLAQNSCGTVKDYDGNTYATVQIGEQCWMKENLRTTHFSDGTAIPAGGDEKSDDEPYYYDYSGSNIPLSARGYLYNWPAAMHGASSSNTNPSHVQGICPNGWHLPSDAEWTQLTDYVGSRSEFVCGGNTENIAKALASTEYWSLYDYECIVGNQSRHPNNATGFSAVPAGDCHGSSLLHAGDYAYFWSSTEHGGGHAYSRFFYYDGADLGRYGNFRSNGFSVRCLRD